MISEQRATSRAHLWTDEKNESPTAAKDKRRVSSATTALKDAKRARQPEVIDLTEDSEPVRRQTVGPGRRSSNPTPPVGSVRSAWLNAAMAWRQKNMPSPSELRKRKADAAQRAARESAARKSRAKEFRFRSAAAASAAAEQERQRMSYERQHGHAANGNSRQRSFAPDPSIVRPADAASLEEWQAYYRAYHGSRIRNAASFVQVLRAFDIPCDDPKKIKVSYMQAVRMYHPDSNSKTRTFKTERDRLEAEEIMKLINQRKPEQF